MRLSPIEGWQAEHSLKLFAPLSIYLDHLDNLDYYPHMMTRMGHTGREMVESGAWVKIGRKQYEHINGAVVRYDCNHYGWQVNNEPERWSALWVARHQVEKAGR